jgi:hypothetical protein
MAESYAPPWRMSIDEFALNCSNQRKRCRQLVPPESAKSGSVLLSECASRRMQVSGLMCDGVPSYFRGSFLSGSDRTIR